MRALNSPALSEVELKKLYTVARLHAFEAQKILKAQHITDLHKEFNIFDNGEVDKHPGYDNFFKEVSSKYAELNLTENPVELANKLINMTKDHEFADDYIKAVRESSTEQKNERLASVVEHFGSDPKAVTSLKGLFRFAKSFRPYGGENMENLVFFYDEGHLKSVPITKVDRNQVGEEVSSLNEIYGNKVAKVAFGLHDNRYDKTQGEQAVDFAALPKADKINLLRQAKARGWLPMFGKASDGVLYFAKLHQEVTKGFSDMTAAHGDSQGFFKNKLKAELGTELADKLEKLAKKQDYFENAAEYYQHALNNHFYLKDLLGENYLANEILNKDGSLKNIVDVLKRFQIIAANSFV
jgi:hypothetical protein